MNIDIRPPAVALSGLDRWLAGFIREERDLPFVHLILQCLAWQLLAVALFFGGDKVWMAAPLYWAGWGLGFVDRFILMLHCTSHRMLFRDKRLNLVIPWVVGPFFGQTPETYYAHHMAMHHPENNLHTDLSTTMPYQRDSLAGWLHYFISFLLTGLTRLAMYHHKHGNKRFFNRMLVGELGFWLMCVGLSAVNWQATLVVFVIPVVAIRLLMMAGNWGQHAFVAAADPQNPYHNSITCIHTRYNRRCFNDGYHILHHLRPATHYTEYPVEFEDNKAEYGRQDAIVFEGIDFFQVWLYLMLGRWAWLAKAFVRLPGAPDRTDVEAIGFLKSRLAPIAAPALA